jgi:predicted RNA-binding Zn-ribbon protein involved in translation (DUF1610 family)
MATKSQLEAENKRLLGELDRLKDLLEKAKARIEWLENPGPSERMPPQSCINCGQSMRPIDMTETHYSCPLCGHEWTDEDEKAPFRR